MLQIIFKSPNFSISYSIILKLKIESINVNILSSFWGWGGEDDDLYYRVRNRKLNITKLSPNLGRFKVGSANCTWVIFCFFFLILTIQLFNFQYNSDTASSNNIFVQIYMDPPLGGVKKAECIFHKIKPRRIEHL